MSMVLVIRHHFSSAAGFLEFLVGGMSYPSETVKSAVVYVLVQVCSKAAHNSLPIPLVQNMCRHISTNLATAKSQELTINLLGMTQFLFALFYCCLHAIV